MGPGRRARKPARKRKWMPAQSSLPLVFSEQQSFLLDAVWSHIHLTPFQGFKVFSFWFGFSKYYQIMKG